MKQSKENKSNRKAEKEKASAILAKSHGKDAYHNLTRKPSAEEAGIAGPVRQLKETFHRARKVKGVIVPGKMEGSKYERKNYVVTYYESGFKKEEHVYGIDGASYISSYNEKGLETGMKSFVEDGSMEWDSAKEYDENGRLIETKSLSKDGSFRSSNTWKYDEKGNTTEFDSYDAEGALESHRILIYDDKGHLIEQKAVQADGTITHHTTQKNDHMGKPIEVTRYDKDGNVEKVETHTYTYNEEGKMTSHNGRRWDDKEPETTFEYEDDARGNWIKKIEFYKKIPTTIYLREITYYDDADASELTIHIEPEKKVTTREISSNSLSREEKERMKSANKEQMKTEEMNDTAKAQWVGEGSSVEIFNAMRYYIAKNGEQPSTLTYSGMDTEVIALREELIENMGAKVIHANSNIYGGHDEKFSRFTLSFPNSAYLLQATQIQQDSMHDYRVPDFIMERIDRSYQQVFTSPLTLYYPSDASGKRDAAFEEELHDTITMCSLETKPEKPEIYMVEVRGSAFALQPHPVHDSFEIQDLDINYGIGFSKFHNELMLRFQNESKGLVLFHGEPGTGKTYYIRHLLRKMASNNKIVIYMPPNLVDHLVDPGFMTFLSGEVQSYSDDGMFCVLLIEDAEPLLAARQSETRIQGVTNLLNMTDGLLNDMLKLQIICTFNVGLKKLDSALLRPGRLIARKEFKPLPELEANILASRLGIKHHFTKAATLSEIYALQKNRNTLIHDVDEDGRDV